MTPAISMTRADASLPRPTSGPGPGLLDFDSIPSDAMTPWPPLLCWRPARAHHESVESKITPGIRGESTKMQHCDKSVIACAQSGLRHWTRSMADEGLEHGPDIGPRDEVGDIIELGRLPIDDD